ncbi:tryptophan 7-halogenase [Simiduia litorea]|uniref:tryptophan halogenase family protein n=1 Tax=Simiduia litorea TaxID=1435348 RepID=UPI0036F2E902
MNKPILSVVIVGGGTAGWLSAGTLAAKLNAATDRAVSISLVESPNLPTIGVGEGTWPSLRRTLKTMGIRETDFIRQCDVGFKQGAKFSRWVNGKNTDAYYHPLILPKAFSEVNLAPQWLKNTEQTTFSAAVCPQDALCDAGLGPKKITTPEYAGLANYAYHLDAGAFSEFIRQHCIQNLGVHHYFGDVEEIINAENGDIAAVVTKQQGRIDADLFIDCTGSRSLLLGGHFGIPFLSCKDTLFIDTALAVHAPYATPDSPLATHTTSTAQRAGWIWDIGLPSRRGVGHVFSSAHTSVDQAHDELMAYLRPSTPNLNDLQVRQIAINPGHREKFWHKNCVAIGMSAGFLEPLEASAILLIEIAGNFIADQFPTSRVAMEQVATRFNETFLYRWARIIDFLKLHYVLSQRTDSAFWVDNRDANSIPESLASQLLYWQEQCPWHSDFDRAVEVFPAASYQYVLYGMGFHTRTDLHPQSQKYQQRAHQLREQNQRETQQLLSSLPVHRELIEKIHQYGLQAV